MVDDLVDSSAIASDLHKLAEPIKERLDKVEREIETAEALLQGLKLGRAQLRHALKAVDPTYEPPDGRVGRKGAAGKRTTPPTRPSEKAVAEVTEILEKHRDEFTNGDGMTSGRLFRRDDWPYSESYTKVILDTLHERGVIRLDRIGRGGAHIFVLV